MRIPSTQTLINILIRRQFRSLGEPFIEFATREIFESEKLTRRGLPSYISSYFPPYPSKAFGQFLRALEAQKRGQPVPEMVNIAVTSKCNYDCWHCSQIPDSTELTTNELLYVIEQLLDMGCYHIGLTGGEPLLRDDLPHLIASIKKRATSLLYTTGYGLTERIARQLKRSGLTAMQISLDHSDPKEHDSLRHFEGSFKIALEAIRLSQRSGLMTCVTTVATAERLSSGELNYFFRLMKKIGVEEITVFESTPTGKLAGRDDIFLEPKLRANLQRLHLSSNRSKNVPRLVILPYVESCHRMGCQAGNTRFYITSGGNVTPCDFTPLSFGNVREESLENIITQMQTFFPKPRPVCFFRQNYHRFKEIGWKNLPYPPEISIKFCSKTPETEYPLFHKKLTE